MISRKRPDAQANIGAYTIHRCVEWEGAIDDWLAGLLLPGA